jgi:hypothetical protein
VGPLGIQRDLGSAAVPVQDRARIVADPRSAHGDRSAEGPTL